MGQAQESRGKEQTEAALLALTPVVAVAVGPQAVAAQAKRPGSVAEAVTEHIPRLLGRENTGLLVAVAQLVGPQGMVG
jgi:hypothetical protein